MSSTLRNKFHAIEFMSLVDARDTARRGAAVAITLTPLKSDGNFRFPHAMLYAAFQLGQPEAARLALNASQRAGGAHTMGEAKEWVHGLVRSEQRRAMLSRSPL